MKKKLILCICFVLFLGFLWVSSGSGYAPIPEAKKYVLKYQMPVGSKFTVKAVHEYARETILPDGEMTGNTIDDEFEGLFTVKSGGGSDGAKLEMEIKKIFRESINPGGTFPDDFPELTGSKVTFGISPSGELSGLEAFNSLPQIDIFLRCSAADHYVHRIHNSFPVLPAKAVSIGDTWTSKMASQRDWWRGIKAEVSSVYTYKLVEETELDGIDCLKIEVSVIQKSAAKGDFQGRDMFAEYEGEGKETVYFACKKGMFVKKEGSMIVKGTLRESPQTDEIKYSYSVSFD
jgi:hypothetical protein